MIPCIFVNDLNEVFNFKRYHYDKELEFDNNYSTIFNDFLKIPRVILINEGQFFNDLYDWVKDAVDIRGCNVYVCGLDGDSNRNKFGKMLDLIPLCDEVTKLLSRCVICNNGNKAPFTLRTIKNDSQVLIGNEDCYKPVCRECYISFTYDK
jgi:thymidine kinase